MFDTPSDIGQCLNISVWYIVILKSRQLILICCHLPQTFNKYWLKSVRFSSVTIINTIIKTHFGDLIPFLFDIQKVPCFVDVLIDMSLNSMNFYSAVNLIYKNYFINHSISCRSKMLNLPWSILKPEMGYFGPHGNRNISAFNQTDRRSKFLME